MHMSDSESSGNSYHEDENSSEEEDNVTTSTTTSTSSSNTQQPLKRKRGRPRNIFDNNTECVICGNPPSAKNYNTKLLVDEYKACFPDYDGAIGLVCSSCYNQCYSHRRSKYSSLPNKKRKHSSSNKTNRQSKRKKSNIENDDTAIEIIESDGTDISGEVSVDSNEESVHIFLDFRVLNENLKLDVPVILCCNTTRSIKISELKVIAQQHAEMIFKNPQIVTLRRMNRDYYGNELLEHLWLEDTFHTFPLRDRDRIIVYITCLSIIRLI
jgi:hypothetical protein